MDSFIERRRNPEHAPLYGVALSLLDWARVDQGKDSTAKSQSQQTQQQQKEQQEQTKQQQGRILTGSSRVGSGGNNEGGVVEAPDSVGVSFVALRYRVCWCCCGGRSIPTLVVVVLVAAVVVCHFGNVSSSLFFFSFSCRCKLEVDGDLRPWKLPPPTSVEAPPSYVHVSQSGRSYTACPQLEDPVLQVPSRPSLKHVLHGIYLNELRICPLLQHRG